MALILFYIAGITLIVASLYLSYWRGKRKFNRRNMVGVETFSSYNKYLGTRWLENSAQFISMLFMILGIILLLAALFDGKDILHITHF